MATSEPECGSVRSRKYALAAVLVGAALTAISFLPALVGGTERWTTDQAREYQNASMQIQKLTHELGGQSPDTASRETSVEFEAAINRFQDLRAKLVDARARSRIWPTTLRVVGIVFVIAGLANYFAAARK
jgi:hypothetical protein